MKVEALLVAEYKEVEKIAKSFQVELVHHRKRYVSLTYSFLLSSMMKRSDNFKYLIVLEDDLTPSHDFIRYFKHFAPLLDKVAPIFSIAITHKRILHYSVSHHGVTPVILTWSTTKAQSTEEIFLLDLAGW